MSLRPFAWAAVLVVAWLAATGATAQTFPELTGRVVDQARLLSAEREAALTERLEALEAQTGDQVVIVTVNSLEGLPIEDYGYRLGRAWGIGQAESDNGALLIVAPNERKVRIEVGYGLEPVLTDALSARIIHDEILPAFRVGGFERGVTQGTDAIIGQLTLDREEALARAHEADRPEPTIVLWSVLIVICVVLGLGAIGLIQAARATGRRGRGRQDGLAPILIWMASEAARSSTSGSGRGSGGSFGGGFGGFSGGGGSFGGGGASGGW